MVLDAPLQNSEHYKGKVEQSKGRFSALPRHHSVVGMEKGTFVSSSTTIASINFTYIYIYY